MQWKYQFYKCFMLFASLQVLEFELNSKQKAADIDRASLSRLTIHPFRYNNVIPCALQPCIGEGRSEDVISMFHKPPKATRPSLLAILSSPLKG